MTGLFNKKRDSLSVDEQLKEIYLLIRTKKQEMELVGTKIMDIRNRYNLIIKEKAVRQAESVNRLKGVMNSQMDPLGSLSDDDRVETEKKIRFLNRQIEDIISSPEVDHLQKDAESLQKQADALLDDVKKYQNEIKQLTSKRNK